MKRFSKFIQEPLDLDEAVEVSHDRYMRSHGKKASGGEGSWMFTHKRMGDANVNDPKEVHSARGKFSDVKKSAQQWAKKHGHSTVYVMEEVKLDEAVKIGSKVRIHAPGKDYHGKVGHVGEIRKRTYGTMAPSYTVDYREPGEDHNRSVSLSREKIKLHKEEVEQIDEISKDLATNYYRKASKDIGDQARSANDLRGGSSDLKGRLDRTYNRDGSRTNPEDRKKDSDTISRYDTSRKTAERKVKNRAVGMSRASTRMEEVELDEVSTEKLRDYASAALQDKNKAKADKRWKYAGKAMQTVADREVKAAHARKYNKMEEVELDEISKSALKSYISKKSQQIADKDKKSNPYNLDGFTGSSRERNRDFDKLNLARKKVREEVDLDEAKTDIYHKHMLKALGKSRLPKDHSFTSAIANNGDFVVKDGGGRTVGRIPKGEHNLKDK